MHDHSIPLAKKLFTTSAEGAPFVADERIRSSEPFTLLPPSGNDILNSITNRDINTRVVDGGGVWTYGVSSDSPQGEALRQRLENAPTTRRAFFERFLEENHLQEQDVYSLVARVFSAPVSSLQNVYTVYTEAAIGARPIASTSEADKHLIRALGDMVILSNGQVFGKELYDDAMLGGAYTHHQLETALARSQSNPQSQEAAINKFIEYNLALGITVTYTPFPQK